MAIVKIFFSEDLRIFLPPENDDDYIPVVFKEHETVKHVIESIGVPHTEVDVILINGNSVDFHWYPKNGDKIEVYSRGKDWRIRPVIHLQPPLIDSPRFVLDCHLGKLATYLRILGIDALYNNRYDDEVLAEISSQEYRVLLTRDRGLLKRSVVWCGYFVRAMEPKSQLSEVTKEFNLKDFADPFSRCVNCNGILEVATKEKILDRLEPKTKLYYDDFKICSDCSQIYWRGSHFIKMEKFVQDVLGDAFSTRIHTE